MQYTWGLHSSNSVGQAGKFRAKKKNLCPFLSFLLCSFLCRSVQSGCGGAVLKSKAQRRRLPLQMIFENGGKNEKSAENQKKNGTKCHYAELLSRVHKKSTSALVRPLFSSRKFKRRKKRWGQRRGGDFPPLWSVKVAKRFRFLFIKRKNCTKTKIIFRGN